MNILSKRVLIGDPDGSGGERTAELLTVLGLDSVIALTGSAALASLEQDGLALALLSVELSDPCAYELLHRMRQRAERSHVIALMSTVENPARDEVAALLLGADEYFTKPLQADLFLARVRRLVARGASGAVNGHAAGLSALTRREHEVLSLLASGQRPAEIAQALCITRKTAATHIERILAKLGAHSQSQAVSFALRSGILEGASAGR